ncbi:hypothetical protein LINGRAPRIM_LOCUS641 [Linum grandiflorum]
MIQLLLTVLFSQMAFIIVLVFKSPLRKLAIMGLDRLKRGRGPIVVSTVAGTVVLVLMSSVYSMVNLQKRWTEEGAVISPTDQVLMATHLLEATLMGGLLFLALMIDRLHHYMRELRMRRKDMEALRKQMQKKALQEELTTLRSKLKQLETEMEVKAKEVNTSKANVVALRKQSDGFVLEYDRLLEENQLLRNKLKSLDLKFSRSGSKKDS